MSGNRCVQGLPEEDRQKVEKTMAPNLLEWQRKRVFAHRTLSAAESKRGLIGIPRVLNFYDDFPFWETLLRTLGFRVVLSQESSDKIFAKGMSSMPVRLLFACFFLLAQIEAICSPVKMVHGHIADLVERLKPPFILLPSLPFTYRDDQNSEFKLTYSSKPVYYSCALIAGYHDVINKNMDLDTQGIRLLHPIVPIFDQAQTIQKLFEYFSPIFPDMAKKEMEGAVKAAYSAQQQYRDELRKQGEGALRYIQQAGGNGIIIAGRSYHLDAFFGSATISNMLSTAGYTVLTSDSIYHLGHDVQEPSRMLNVFASDGRIISAAKFASRREDIALIHVVSFGCSVSAETDDEIKVIATCYHHLLL